MTVPASNKGDLERLRQLHPAMICNAGGAQVPSLHLFHAPNSICSQKVRTMLFEANAPFQSHEMNIGKGETYEPSYVRLRARACLASGIPFVSDHTGSTSVAETGCDACVVPTVVDDESGEVLIDSVRICFALDTKFGRGLRPAAIAADIDREIARVDGLPNYPLLASKMFARSADDGNPFAQGKVERCDRLIGEHAEDQLLVAAYAGKRDKELAANTNLFSDDALAKAEATMQSALAALSDRLSHTPRFLFGDAVTLADLFWAAELIRIRDLGYGDWVDELPRLQEFDQVLCALPSIQKAILTWPDARPNLPYK